MSHLPKSLYYVSDYAYAELCNSAQANRYVAQGAKRMHGLSAFLAMLSTRTYRDTRPPYVKQRHIEEIRSMRAPTWRSHRPRRARLLGLSQETHNNFTRIALQFGIIKNEVYLIGGPDRHNPVAVTSYVLEAIGLGWITQNES